MCEYVWALNKMLGKPCNKSGLERLVDNQLPWHGHRAYPQLRVKDTFFYEDCILTKESRTSMDMRTVKGNHDIMLLSIWAAISDDLLQMIEALVLESRKV